MNVDLDIGEGSFLVCFLFSFFFFLERKWSIFLASDRNKMYLTKLEMVALGGARREAFFSVHDFLKKSRWKNPHHVWAHAEGWRCRHAIGFRHCLDKDLSQSQDRVPFRKLPLLCCCSSFLLFFFSTAKDLGLRDCPDDLFSVPKGLINLKNPTRQLKPLPKTVIRSAFSTASFLCFCCRDRSTLKDAAWHFLIQQQQGKWWGSDLGVYEFSLYSVISE